MCDLDCGERGHCEGGVCVCDEGWRGNFWFVFCLFVDPINSFYENFSFKARTVRCNVVTLDVPHTVFAPMVSRDSHPEQFSSNAKEEWDFTKIKEENCSKVCSNKLHLKQIEDN